MNADWPLVWNFSNASARLPKSVTSTKAGFSVHSPVCESL